ncbi:phosphate/phosphite/phosphonate ABC transporter substrate-binding protein [Bombilactobacillus bombi]|uniref:phosphate/phosphite/phosphonate ABC transporter substrate-binding protein n=1 Tax=Bombilactobacillus bombi TaxID=1303590 RepID=UPI0015E625DD|nr:phosphate/phosphite/phosphonate ABC transporter substrate-binding protein [Bombilactobacillus bombi]MBA1434234.1 phosphate/phosphite/phosphonate ABC transporter substrate-binding protein [Bombilactobacillus bombi]
MFNWKQKLTTALAIAMAATPVLASTAQAAQYTPHKLTVQFVPSTDANSIEAKAKPLEGLLSKQLGIPVKVSVSTNDNTIVEAMGAKKVDVGFLPPDAYVQAHQQYHDKVILQSLRHDSNKAGTKESKKLVDFFRAQIFVHQGSKIKNIKDLKGKKIAVQETASTSGWIYPVVELYQHGIDINKNKIKTVQVKGHDQGILSVYNKDTDAAFAFQRARMIVQKDTPDVMKKVVPIYTTAKIPNDTITVRGDMSPKWQQKIASAFIKIAKTKKGHKIISDVYSHEGYVRSKDSNFNIIRKYDKIAQKINH